MRIYILIQLINSSTVDFKLEVISQWPWNNDHPGFLRIYLNVLPIFCIFGMNFEIEQAKKAGVYQ